MVESMAVIFSSKQIWNFSLSAFLLTAGCVCLPGAANAQSPSFGWGVHSTGTTTTHNDDALSAIVAEQGRNSLLSDVTVYSVGVINTIEVVGDNNLLTSTQDGSNTGDVSSDVSVTVSD